MLLKIHRMTHEELIEPWAGEIQTKSEQQHFRTFCSDYELLAKAFEAGFCQRELVFSEMLKILEQQY